MCSSSRPCTALSACCTRCCAVHFSRLPMTTPGNAADGRHSGISSSTAPLDFTSSVTIAGVLLVFSFLIIPAVIGFLFSDRMGAALAAGWSAGIMASLAGFGVSVVLDIPTGATMVATFAVSLLLAAALRVFFVGSPIDRRANGRRLALAAGALAA